MFKLVIAVSVLILIVKQAVSVEAIYQPSLKGGPSPFVLLASSKSKSNSKVNVQLRSSKGKSKSEKQSVIVAVSKKGEQARLNAFDLCLCGAFATAFGDFVMHPVDTIKVMQQTATTTMSMLACAKQILVKSGPAGFYTGVVPYMIADGLSGAIKFASFEISKVFVQARVPVQFHPLTQFVCAAGAMIACSVVMIPGEVIKTRMQAGVATSLIGGITQTLKDSGIGGLFAGYYATLVRDIPYTMLELGLYENIKTIIRKYYKTEQLSQKDELFAAAVTGGITGFITTPLDLVKTKLMVQTSGAAGGYGGVIDALTSIYKQGGIEALFVGSSARVAWLLPFTTIYLGVYEISKRKILEIKYKANDDQRIK